ncbi:hypothetical protein SAMN05216228_1015119 [Rhizobium tibeticum]|uniref:Uncharacterized protein n=1 Tax=Rhizobium tibeticum TaxID=501024 RepID=A0A1H8NWZ8_9HYPH|nr:hypothetical protein RTCCBAU85039_3590 [Rhizobium tibeticum]SEO34092.1 hypothetical protein SAMN05216228_1015119 [Rhizobium tibeticum]
MQYAVVRESEICMIARSLAQAEIERDYFSARYGKTVAIVAIDDDIGACARLHRQLSIRNPRDEI